MQNLAVVSFCRAASRACADSNAHALIKPLSRRLSLLIHRDARVSLALLPRDAIKSAPEPVARVMTSERFSFRYRPVRTYFAINREPLKQRRKSKGGEGAQVRRARS